MSAKHQIRISVPSSVGFLNLVQRLAEEIGTALEFEEDVCLDFGLAVREGAINAMKHGHEYDDSLPVDISFEMEANEVIVSIRDVGKGFDPEKAPDPTAEENLWKTSGRGLLMIRTLVDDVQLERRNPGMELKLVKRRPDEEAAEG